MSDKIILKATNVFKNYFSPDKGSIEILKNLNLQVQEQDSISIMGKSGSGKSTLLNVLAGLDTIDRGEIIVDDKNIWKVSDEILSRMRNKFFGFIFQTHFLLPEFSALENVMMPSLIQGRTSGEKRAKDLLSQVGLADRMSHKPSALSGGEAQRVAIARSLMNSPKIIFADEPTGNLDRENAEHTVALMMNLVREHKSSLILITHDQKIANLTARRYSLINGQLHEV